MGYEYDAWEDYCDEQERAREADLMSIFEFDISNLKVNESALQDAIVSRLSANLSYKWNEELDRAVKHAVEKRVEVVSEEALREAVMKILEEGWTKTNTYGDSTGTKVTLSQWVREYVMGSVGRYSSNEVKKYAPMGGEMKKLHYLIGKLVEAEVKDLLKEVVPEIKKQIKEAFESNLTARFASIAQDIIRFKI